LVWRARSGGAVPFGSKHLVEDGARLLGELGPFGWPGAVVAGLEHTVGNRDLASGQVGLGAPSGPGWYGAVVAVEVGFDVVGVVAPHGPACGCARRRPDPLDEVTGRVLGEVTRTPIG
jgi:hypothetical protein